MVALERIHPSLSVLYSPADWESINEDNMKADKFIAVVRKYTDFKELTTPMLNEFIEKVVVHEATGGRKNRRQKVDVYFNFVGQVKIPEPDRDSTEEGACNETGAYRKD